ncbi:hypothetical protein HUX88_12300 [Duganella sp. BJB1802]|uniref:hypothetical protein n=1 Tax=Duganella sp. BJB1802 TaxID=2744575 RepID=UPI001593ED67|nr:hypothetical protein [Duganella sp. BJB1802]NVD71332.1 hypothetical protein [Duganella sp. BJB1802]
MTNVRLTRQICAFIDVLGGAKLFRGKDKQRASEFFACLEEFERRMNAWSPHFPAKRRTKALVKTFSDNIFVAFPFKSSTKMDDDDVIGTFLEELIHQIHELTMFAGFPIRGAVSIGGLMFTDKFLFGPALVEAVELEKSAIFPRIVLSESVLRHIKPGSPIARRIVCDVDGKSFLHYLGGLSSGWLEHHKTFVENGLQENSRHVRERQKYEWLAQYHNFSAQSAKKPEHAISIDRSSAFSAFQPKTT